MNKLILGLVIIAGLPAFPEAQGPRVESASAVAYVNTLAQRVWFLPQPSSVPALDKFLTPEVGPTASVEPVQLPAGLEADER